MKHTRARFNIGAQVRVSSRTSPIVKFLPILLFAALIAAIAFLG